MPKNRLQIDNRVLTIEILYLKSKMMIDAEFYKSEIKINKRRYDEIQL
jgi:hypothetical protein